MVSDLVAGGWKTKIRNWAKELGFVAVGFTTADSSPGLPERLQERYAQGLATAFESEDFGKRSDPRQIWSKCRCVVALAYPLPLSGDSKPGEGILVRSAVGEDYHSVVRRKLRELSALMLGGGWDTEMPRFQVDTGPLVEREFAVRSGVGWVGRNQLLIVPGYGSFVALALMLLDQELSSPNSVEHPDREIPNQCGECQRCIQACPAKILGKANFAAVKCYSYLTQSKQLSLAEGLTLENRVYGCDTCQEVCPYNQERIKVEAEKDAKLELQRGVDLMEVLNLTKGQFNDKYRATAAGWRGKGILQRNAYLALRYQRDSRLEDWVKKGIGVPLIVRDYLE